MSYPSYDFTFEQFATRLVVGTLPKAQAERAVQKEHPEEKDLVMLLRYAALAARRAGYDLETLAKMAVKP